MEVKKFVCLFLVATLGISCSMGEKDKKEERMSVRVFCAEKAVSEGERSFAAIAIVAGPENGDLVLTAPCGVCRQVMMEFCNPKTFQIILAVDKERYEIYTLEELMPLGFGPLNLV